MIENISEKLRVIDKLVATGTGSRIDHIVAQKALQEIEDYFCDDTQPTQGNVEERPALAQDPESQ